MTTAAFVTCPSQTVTLDGQVTEVVMVFDAEFDLYLTPIAEVESMQKLLAARVFLAAQADKNAARMRGGGT